MFKVNKQPSRTDLRKFGWAMLLGFSVLGSLLWLAHYMALRPGGLFVWTGSGKQIAAVALWALGPALWFVSRAPRSVARPVYVVWMSGAVGMGIVMSTVMLSVLFFLLLPIFSVIVRRGDPLRRRRSRGGSYWEDHSTLTPTLERMARLF